MGVGTFCARGRGVRVKNVAEGNGKCFRIRSKKGARRMDARDARSDGRRHGVGTMRLDALSSWLRGFGDIIRAIRGAEIRFFFSLFRFVHRDRAFVRIRPSFLPVRQCL